MDSPKILVLGASGQIGSALMKQLGDQGIGLSRSEGDLTRSDSLKASLEKHRPTAVINAAAYTQVDRAESEEALAYQINAEAPGQIAQWCADQGIPWVHYSTDYVYPGQGTRPWVEADPTGPLNVYGRSKLEGEKRVMSAGGSYLILRTSWVYDRTGKNFVNTVLRLAREKDKLTIVSDQHGAPSYAWHLAQATLSALAKAQKSRNFPSGIYHVCNSGVTNWCEFAQTIVQLARQKGVSLRVQSIEPIPTASYPTPAKRPLNSRLDLSKFESTFDIRMPNWLDGLKECMEIAV